MKVGDTLYRACFISAPQAAAELRMESDCWPHRHVRVTDTITVDAFVIYKETPCYWWLKDAGNEWVRDKPKRMAKHSRLPWARPTEEEAIKHLIERTERRVINMQYETEALTRILSAHGVIVAPFAAHRRPGSHCLFTVTRVYKCHQ